MKRLADSSELETLGGLMVREYLTKTKRWRAVCFDIEAFITDYLHVTIEFESFAEDDPGKLGFMADGKTPVKIWRKKVKQEVVFPENTIVIEKYLLSEGQSARKRFTEAHEAAHVILSRHIPGQAAAAFHSEFDEGTEYPLEDLKKIFSLSESQADRLGAALLMPQHHIKMALDRHNGGKPFTCYEGGIFSQDDKLKLQRMADSLGASYTALVYRLKELGLTETRPIGEYMERLGFGEVCNG